MEKGLLLLSGGIDSVVAGKLIKEKYDLDAIHFHNYPFTDDSEMEKAVKLGKVIGVKKIYIVDHGSFQKEVMKHCNRRYQCILCKRMMFRVASALADEKGYSFLVTGDNLAQVASQTLENMETTDLAASKTILRPLLCYDKEEIVEIAKKIGSYDVSTGPGVCCMAVPPNPATKSVEETLEKEEENLEMDALVKNALNSIKTKEI